MIMLTWFRKVTFACTDCGATQHIPLRRIHFFERFHDLCQGQAILIRCPQCGLGLQIPGPYQSYTGQSVTVDPETLPKDAFIHEAFC